MASLSSKLNVWYWLFLVERWAGMVDLEAISVEILGEGESVVAVFKPVGGTFDPGD